MSNDKHTLPERLLVAGLTALVIARCLIADDPGRLRLTSGGGPLTLNILSFVLLFGWAVWRGVTRQPLRKGSGWVVVLGLLIVAGLSFASTMQPNRYQHPGWFISWNWLAVAALCFVAWQMCSAEVAKGLVMVLLATVTCIAIQNLSRWLMPDWQDYSPPTEPPLAGEFGQRGSWKFNRLYATSETCGVLLSFLLFPAAIALAMAGWRRSGIWRTLWILPILLLATSLSTPWSSLIASYHGHNDPDLGYVVIRNGGMQLEFWYRVLPAPSELFLWSMSALVVVGALFSWWRAGMRSDRPQITSGSNLFRWTFYSGGIFGLLLGMILATGDIPAEAPASELLRLGATAAVRAVVWFLAFSVLESLTVSVRAIHRSLALGVVLCFIGSFHTTVLPSFAIVQSMFLALLIAFQSPIAEFRQAPSRVAAWLPVPLALALLVANLLHVSLPGLSTASNVRAARAASKEFPELQFKIEGRSGPDRIKAVRDALGYLDHFIIAPLRDANAADEGNSALMLELARWKRIRWTYLRELHDFDAARREGLDMLALAEHAAKADPENLGARWAVYEALLLFVQETTVATAAQLSSLDKYIGLIAEREPAKEVELRFRVVQALLTGRNPEAVDSWSVRLLQLEGESGHGNLTEEQRSRLMGALIRLPQPSAELQKYLPPPEKKKKEPEKK